MSRKQDDASGGLPRTAKILIAEDEALIAEELRDRLEEMGYEVVEVVDSGEQAVAAALSLKPDLVLMDIRLNGQMDGIEAADQIRLSLGLAVVYLTAHSDPSTVRRAKRTSPLGYLIKPVGEKELRVTVEMALHKAELERQLQESEARFATTLTSIGDAVIATDAQGHVTFLNPVAENLLRWNRQDALGLPLDQVFRLVNAVTREPLESPVARALREDQVVLLPHDTMLIARDHSELLISDSAAPIRDAKQQVRGVVLVFRDATEKEHSENALKKAEQQIRQAQKMEAVGQLAGGVAHDINNLMTVVSGFGELILEKLPFEHPLREMVAEMKQAGDRAATITRQLLAFSRKEVLIPEVIDLNKIVAEMGLMLSRLIGTDVKLRTLLAADLLPIKADQVQIEQIILNLAVNARDAMPDGGELTLQTEMSWFQPLPRADIMSIPAGRYVVLSVTDTGMGMDAVTRAQVFEPFFTTKGAGKGTGLGLATVYSIVKQSGGHIKVYSELGHGSVFKIFLPLAEGKIIDTTPEKPPALIRGHETILLVEDDDSVRRVAQQILESCGYTVLGAADGEEAMLMGQQKSRIDLLLTDAIMPNMSGRVLAQRFTSLRPETRVLFMSGYTEDYVLRHEAEWAGVGFVQKPFTVANLTERVRRTLDQPRVS